MTEFETKVMEDLMATLSKRNDRIKELSEQVSELEIEKSDAINKALRKFAEYLIDISYGQGEVVYIVDIKKVLKRFTGGTR